MGVDFLSHLIAYTGCSGKHRNQNQIINEVKRQMQTHSEGEERQLEL